VRIENDANAAALAESWFGCNADLRDTLFVLYEGGLGAGIVVDGTVYRGKHHAAGEFSHTLVATDQGLQCAVCGRRGCLDAMTSPYAINEMVYALRERQPGESLHTIIERADAAKEPDRSVMWQALEFVSTGLANLIQILDPAEVLLGGEIFLQSPSASEKVIERIRALGYQDIPILPASFGIDAVAVGAAALILQDVYNPTSLITLG
jgi:predicted NBD/HSP70 family sugar kinase